MAKMFRIKYNNSNLPAILLVLSLVVVFTKVTAETY